MICFKIDAKSLSVPYQSTAPHSADPLYYVQWRNKSVPITFCLDTFLRSPTTTPLYLPFPSQTYVFSVGRVKGSAHVLKKSPVGMPSNNALRSFLHPSAISIHLNNCISHMKKSSAAACHQDWRNPYFFIQGSRTLAINGVIGS